MQRRIVMSYQKIIPPPYIRKTTPINLSRQVIEYVTNC